MRWLRLLVAAASLTVLAGCHAIGSGPSDGAGGGLNTLTDADRCVTVRIELV